MRLMQEQRDNIVPSYLGGESSVKIARRLGVHPSSVLMYLSRRQIPRRKQKRYRIDESYFENLNSEGPAYWFGFLLADGSIVERKYGLGYLAVALGAVDRGHLEKLRASLKSSHPINRRKDGTVWIQIKRRKLVESLRLHGCLPRKGLSLEFPHDVSHSQMHHFMRGFFDGDGSLFRSGGGWRFKVVARKNFAEQYQRVLVESCGLRFNKLYGNSSDMWSVRYGDQTDMVKIVRYLYRGATVFLDRKMKLAKQIAGGDHPLFNAV